MGGAIPKYFHRSHRNGVRKFHQDNLVTQGIIHEAPPHLADLHPKCLEHFTGFQNEYQMLYKRMNWTKTTSAICDDPPYLFICLQTNQPTPGLKHLFCRGLRVKLNPPTLAKRFKWRRYSSKSLTHVDKSMSVFGISSLYSLQPSSTTLVKFLIL